MRRYLPILFVGIAALIFSFFNSILAVITDWLFYVETGYQDIFLLSLQNRVLVFVILFLSTSAFFILNILFASGMSKEWLLHVPREIAGKTLIVSGNIARKILILVALALSFLMALGTSSLWREFYKAVYSEKYNVMEPIFSQDVSFYMFYLPVAHIIVNYISFVVFLSLVLVLIISVFKQVSSFIVLKDWKNFINGFNKPTRLHLGLLFMAMLITLAMQTVLSTFDILYSQVGVVYGAGFTDSVIRLPMLYGIAGVLVFSAIASLLYALSGATKPLIAGVAMYLLLMVGNVIIPLAVQSIYVDPNELNVEREYIENHINLTRKAYNLDNVEERTIGGEGTLTMDDINENQLTLRNVRLWDRAPLLSTFSQLQEIRTYYDFVSVDNDRYMIDGELRQIMLSPRELSSANLPNKNWINERLTFTHGYGVAAGPVNQVTNEGLPVLFVKDIPPVFEKPELTIDRPEIYYGELTDSYVIVNTETPEFNFPKGDENVFTSYDGEGGVVLDSIWKRLLYAMHLKDYKILLSSDIQNDSRIMYKRNIVERVSSIIPFITLDDDPYMVIAEGKMYWILDGYTMSSNYPYAQPSIFKGNRVNYVRNSVKAIVDAYDGSVKLYVSEPDDPIIKAIANIYPEIFVGMDTMPESLRSHIRYPEDVFAIQSMLFTEYHMRAPQIFYNKEDKWSIPSITTSNDGTISRFEPRHLIMKLPGEEVEEFVLMVPFTPSGKDNLSAWMAARNDGDLYGRLIVYRFPKDSLVFGPAQVISRINQDSEISRQISLWDQRGSRVIQGPLLVIPIGESLIYVRPLYLQAENGKIPELNRVIVAYENRIAMAESLDGALQQIFGGSTSTSGSTSSGATSGSAPSNGSDSTSTSQQPTLSGQDAARLREAQTAYQNALEAQRSGNWTRYGEEIQRLGNILNELSD